MAYFVFKFSVSIHRERVAQIPLNDVLLVFTGLLNNSSCKYNEFIYDL